MSNYRTIIEQNNAELSGNNTDLQSLLNTINTLPNAGITQITTETPTNINGLLKGNGSTVQTATAGMDYAIPSKGVTVTLPAAGWSDNTQVINVSGYNTSERNFIAPDYASIPEYAACGIRAIESMGALTFTCNIVPENDLTINVAMGV